MSDYPNAPQRQSDDPAPESFAGLTRYERHSEIRQISYYVSGSIVQSNYYNELFYTLRTATETDLIYLHLNTCGGDFDTGLQLINNMMASNAHVVAVLEARAYSMGAFIFLAADELVVHDNCQLLFHSYSGVFSGKGNEQQAQGLALASWFEKFMERICQPFLTLAEIKGILKGADMWMDSDEIRHRMARMQRAQAKLVSPQRDVHKGAHRQGPAPPIGAEHGIPTGQAPVTAPISPRKQVLPDA